MVKASINSDNEKAGGRTSNFQGCDSGNPTKSMPTGYLGVRATIIRETTGGFCSSGSGPYYYTQATGYTVTATIDKVTASYCPSTAAYYGYSPGRRYVASESDYRTVWQRSAAINF